MPRKKGQKKRAPTERKTAASVKSKPKRVYVTELINPTAAQKKLLYSVRRKRREEEKLNRRLENQRRQRARLTLEDKAKISEKTRQYRANLSPEIKRIRRERDKLRQRMVRARKPNLTEKDLAIRKSMADNIDDEDETSGDELLVVLKPRRVKNDDNDVSSTTTTITNSQKRKSRSDLPLAKLLIVRERDKQRQRIKRAKQSNISEEDIDTLDLDSDRNDDDESEKCNEEVPVGLSPSIRKRGRQADLATIKEKDALQKRKKKVKKKLNALDSDSDNDKDEKKQIKEEVLVALRPTSVTNIDNDVSSTTTITKSG